MLIYIFDDTLIVRCDMLWSVFLHDDTGSRRTHVLALGVVEHAFSLHKAQAYVRTALATSLVVAGDA